MSMTLLSEGIFGEGGSEKEEEGNEGVEKRKLSETSAFFLSPSAFPYQALWMNVR
jgi:hypothetical protein